MQLSTLDDRDDVSPSGSRWVWWILATAFVLRLLCMLGFGSHQYANEAEMGEIARNILADNGFSLSLLGPRQPTAFIPPFEPYFFALVHYVLGDTPLSYAVLIMCRSALSVASAYIAYCIVRDVWSRRLAVLALCTIAFYPPFRELKIITYPTHCEQGEYPQTIFPNPIGAQSVFQSCSGLLA